MKVFSLDRGRVAFAVIRTNEPALATSVEYSSICSLESALKTLASAMRLGWTVSESPTGSAVKVGRRSVSFHDTLSISEAAKVVETAHGARIVDVRPTNRRRIDLTGLRLDLTR